LQTLQDVRKAPQELAVRAAPTSGPTHSQITLDVYDELRTIEMPWREFERSADCTVFQSFAWLSAWQRHIGVRAGVVPAITVGMRADGQLLFLLPLAVVPGLIRRLTWLGSDLCDYNAPLLAPDFQAHVTRDHFRQIWDEICRLLQSKPMHRYDIVELTKMPESIGSQSNPMTGLGVGLNPSAAYTTELGPSWDEFYRAKRSSATRKKDRTKRKRLEEIGEVGFVSPGDPDERRNTLDVLFRQKAKSLARMGVADIFARPGHRDFLTELALDSATRHLVHVSRLDVGSVPAAVNFGLIFRGCFYHVIASYDDGEVARWGPGAALLRELLAQAIAIGCRQFDFTIGDEHYKLEWSDRTIKLYDYVAHGRLRGWPLAKVALATSALKRRIKGNPKLWSVASRLRAALSSSRKGPAEARLPSNPTIKSPPTSPQ